MNDPARSADPVRPRKPANEIIRDALASDLPADAVAEPCIVGRVDQFGEITLDVGLQFRGWVVVLVPPERHSDGAEHG